MADATSTLPVPETLETHAHTQVVCIGDLHGNLKEAQDLWNAVAEHMGAAKLLRATVVFLGDFCDRGPDTRGVIDWLLNIRDTRRQNGGGPTRFIAGNHDLGFAAYVDALPIGNELSPEELESTKYYDDEMTFQEEVPGGMHFEGRRWGGTYDVYSSRETYISYGIVPDARNSKTREALIAAVPFRHKQFLRELEWVVDLKLTFAPGRMICVHAGLNPDVEVSCQLEALSRRDALSECINKSTEFGRIVALCERERSGVCTESMHPELDGKALLVSGHHGYTKIIKDRWIIDCSGGLPSEERPIHAAIFPERKIVASTSNNSDD